MTSIVTVTPNPAIDHTIFIPNFTAGKVNRVKNERMDVGGKGFNVASFLKDYGIDDVVATGFLGKENSDFFEGFLTEWQIEADFVYLDGKTRTNIKIVDEEKQEITIRIRRDDFKFISEDTLSLLNVIPDDSLKEPGFIIESNFGDIDGTISVQIEELKKEFLKEYADK